jgi:hypothetical protein
MGDGEGEIIKRLDELTGKMDLLYGAVVGSWPKSIGHNNSRSCVRRLAVWKIQLTAGKTVSSARRWCFFWAVAASVRLSQRY